MMTRSHAIRLFKTGLAIGVFVMLAGAASAQQRTHTGQQTPSAANPQLNARSERLENGAVLLPDGAVQVSNTDEQGNPQTITYRLPEVTADTREPLTDVDPKWVEDFKNWISNNPNYANYLSAEEVRFVEADELANIYKLRYYAKQQNDLRNSHNE